MFRVWLKSMSYKYFSTFTDTNPYLRSHRIIHYANNNEGSLSRNGFPETARAKIT